MSVAALNVLGDITSSPVTSLTISVLVGTWVQQFHSRIDPAQYSYSYNDLLRKQQWWRVFTAPFCQTSFLSLLFNVITLWGIRSFEVAFGSWFFFRYTLLLMGVQGLLSAWIVHLIITYSSTQIPFRSVSTEGFYGITLAWLVYQRFSGAVFSDFFYIFGLVPLPWEYAPVFMIIITSYFLIPKPAIVLNIVGVVSGDLLAFGVIQVLPDLYWSLCFVFNVAAFILLQSTFLQSFLSSLNSNNGENLVSVESEAIDQVVENINPRGQVSDHDDVDLEIGRDNTSLGGREERGRGSERDRGRERGSGLDVDISPGVHSSSPSHSPVPRRRQTLFSERAGEEGTDSSSSRYSTRPSLPLRTSSRDERERDRGRDSGDEEGEEGVFEGSGGLSEDPSTRPLLSRGSRR